jgi:hypothetical protein
MRSWLASWGKQYGTCHVSVRLMIAHATEHPLVLCGCTRVSRVGRRYCVCNVYCSLTGFCVESGSGNVQVSTLPPPYMHQQHKPLLQLMATGGLLAERGFKFWDFGMVMDYKVAMGACSVPRAQFRSRLELARKCAATASLPPHLWEHAAQSVARAMQQHPCVQQPLTSCHSEEEVKELILELRARGFGPDRVQEAMARIKAMRARAAEQAYDVAPAALTSQQDDEGGGC